MTIEEVYDCYKVSAGISTDTRTLQQGEMFFAIRGNNFNGNSYAAQALEKGASYVVIDDTSAVGYSEEDSRYILVADTTVALQKLATLHRSKLKAKVIAITGTNGKTTTKELTTAVLSTKYRTHSTIGNLNNQFGVPLTILSAPNNCEMLIIEMGASHIGDISELCNIALPDYGIITNIGTAHIEGFGSFEGVVNTKTELFRFLQQTSGTAFYDDSNPILSEQILLNKVNAIPLSRPHKQHPITISQLSNATTLNLAIDVSNPQLSSSTHATISTHLFGSYNIDNIRAALAIALYFDVDISKAAAAIENYIPSNNRSQIEQKGTNTIIWDAYNANPSSMHSAIESFDKFDGSKKQKVAILGDMRELGSVSAAEHNSVVNLLIEKKFDRVILVGKEFEKASKGVETFITTENVEQANSYLTTSPIHNSIILIKGSNSLKLFQIII